VYDVSHSRQWSNYNIVLRSSINIDDTAGNIPVSGFIVVMKNIMNLCKKTVQFIETL